MLAYKQAFERALLQVSVFEPVLELELLQPVFEQVLARVVEQVFPEPSVPVLVFVFVLALELAMEPEKVLGLVMVKVQKPFYSGHEFRLLLSFYLNGTLCFY